ncbi:MAG: hypothetical protein JWQ25_2092 [Daejeonella sp.]|nr:hypothetical protein [Daejeonella sp.]
MKKLKFALSALVLAVFLLSVTTAQASDNGAGNNGNAGNGNGNSGSGNGNGASLPINKGLVLLLIAGTVLGVKVLKSTQKTVKA